MWIGQVDKSGRFLGKDIVKIEHFNKTQKEYHFMIANLKPFKRMIGVNK